MAHEITDSDLMVSGNAVTPWHRLGIVREGTLSVREARQLVAPWEPELIPVYVKDGDDYTAIPGKQATRRPDTGTVLGVLSDDYGLFKNASGFDVVEQIVDEGDGQVEVETAGTLREGRFVWVLCWLNRELDIAGDRFDPYILGTWGHDGQTAFTVANTYVRVVCANTRTAALSSASRTWKATHLGSIEARVREARHVLKMADLYEAEFVADVENFLAKKVTAKKFTDAIVPAVFPIPEGSSDQVVRNRTERRDQVIDLYRTSDTVQGFKGTGWGAFQAFSTWEEHTRPVMGDRDERRALRVIGKANGGVSVLPRARELILA